MILPVWSACTVWGMLKTTMLQKDSQLFLPIPTFYLKKTIMLSLPVVVIEDNFGRFCTGNGTRSDLLSDVSRKLDTVNLVPEEHLVVRLDGGQDVFSLDCGLRKTPH